MIHPLVRGLALATLLFFGSPPCYSSGQTVPAAFVAAGELVDLPRVTANDNRTPAGFVGPDGVLEVALEIVEADWRVETPDGPGLRVAAFAEAGQAPSVPGPLLRVETGTRLRVSVLNTLPDHPVSMFGLQQRPAADQDSIVVQPGERKTVEFSAGQPGTYLYWARTEQDLPPEEEREQLAGAFIIDPVGGSPPDRIFVINIFSTAIDRSLHEHGWLEALTINGLSWPYTEIQRPAVGDTVRWRVVNASGRKHPMHLHGFFYDVTSSGGVLEDTVYEPGDRRKVVTETMRGRSTMAMEWVPMRPGNWLFHCHLSFHVSPSIRLPFRPDAGHDSHGVHMAGLVLGIEVQPGPTDLIERGDPSRFTLHAMEFGPDSSKTYGFTLDPEFQPDRRQDAVPGPILVMKQYQPTYVTVQNDMSIPTGVHWHGLELDSWADGVPGWSASDGQVSPVIEPGRSFTYKLSLMRPGTFIYHSHLDDVHQLTGGLYGALIVLPESEAFDPDRDHTYVVGWNSVEPFALTDMELNGRFEQPVQHAVVGEIHRIRLINIAPAGMVFARMLKDENPVSLTALAKDGADLPARQRVDLEMSPRFGVGETADFAFTPSEPGTYDLVIGYAPEFAWHQTWEVVASAEEIRDGR